MIALCLIPIYIVVNFYIVRWGIRWMSACHHHFKKKWIRVIIILIYTFIASSILIAFLLPTSPFQRWLKHLSNIWFGTFAYIILTIIIVDLVRIILKHLKCIDQEKLASRTVFVTTGTVCIAIIAGLSIYGTLNARNIRTTNYEIDVAKPCIATQSLRVVLVADFHLGYSIGSYHMQQMVDKINGMNADVVCIAGDIFDNEYEALESPEHLSQILRTLKSKYGVFACYGNHDISEKILAGFTFSNKSKKKQSDIRMDQFLQNSNIQLLRDDVVLIDDAFYIIGRPDYERPGRGITQRKSPSKLLTGIDKSKPIIVLDHEPRELQELADAGVDVDLAGHTHDGQMFPGTITIHFFWENPYGYLKKDKMHNIVTSGIGVFGPNMRVDSKSEICQITMNFK
ncbi:MAG: metallophosphoesterase [Lachnospiraceae bacterium]